ncbi:2-C-methyl-D-erythritol 4-phosphate cytidylyltransferase [Helcobacillus massiliensis]|uniref:2-C-methyl-D-erythritol 4-phosphate cytidylyltransferase n=1 Tax=Helcobacillus massiliensis TaxID=521392 RepID=A0A839QZN7_9MICO|nr:2-C-methyl-D-erythritol 4-phosphate cytidylyltransferase [Helcobacillus massiliensis]MBB3023421.1 2-C-methyl-D-erythritol 4-phosphate cytidylyltransferase [Helcobacillus massiliensis]
MSLVQRAVRSLDSVVDPSVAGGRVGLITAAPGRASSDHAEIAGTAALAAATAHPQDVCRALAQWARRQGADGVLLHDAGRPLTTEATVRSVVQAWRDGAVCAVPGIPVTDSVKSVRGDQLTNIERASLTALQSPIVVDLHLLERALEHEWTTQSAVREMQAIGADVVVVDGSHAGEPMTDELSLWRAQIALGLARDTSGPRRPA